MINQRGMYCAFLLMICTQTLYLCLQFYHFQWYFIDDLLTLELINKNSIIELYNSLLSGVNVFPPLYFLTCYFITNTLGLSENLLVWLNLPTYLIGIYFCYKSFKLLSTTHISILSVTIMCTVKCSVLPYINQVRPYTFYYTLTAILLYFVLRYRNKFCKKYFWSIFLTFQLLSQSHYYGLGIGLIVCLPLLFIKQTLKQKFFKIFIIVLPSLACNIFFLSNQLKFTYSGDLLSESSVEQIYITYSSFFHSTLILIFIISLILIFFLRNLTLFLKILKPPEFSFFLLLLFPILISVLLYLTNIKGMNYRYFIPCQIGLIGSAISIFQHNKVKKYFKNFNYGLIICLLFTSIWTYRNISKEFFNNLSKFKLPAGINLSVLNEIKACDYPLVTNQLSSFLFLKKDSTLQNDIYFLRTKEIEISNFPVFSSTLKPLLLSDLKNIDSFYYHFFKIGDYDIIDFIPEIWANDNNFRCEKLSFHPNFYKLTKF